MKPFLYLFFATIDKTNCCHQHAQLLSLVLEAHIDKRSWSVVPVLHCSDGPGFSLMMVQIMVMNVQNAIFSVKIIIVV